MHVIGNTLAPRGTEALQVGAGFLPTMAGDQVFYIADMERIVLVLNKQGTVTQQLGLAC